MSRRVRARAASSLTALAITTGGIAALTSAAHAAGVTNGPIAYSDGDHWSEVDADGSGQHTITPDGGGFNAADGIRDVAFSPDGSWAAASRASRH